MRRTAGCPSPPWGETGAKRRSRVCKISDLRALPRAWSRFWSSSSERQLAASELALRWRPASPGAELSELELWGFGPDLRARPAAALADRVQRGEQPGAVESWAQPDGLAVSAPAVGLEGTAVFQVRVDTEPRLMGRTFLVYELAGQPHFTAVPRQINGFSVLGGFHPEMGAAGGTQIEEISPDWLFQGDNEVRFYPTEDQGSDRVSRQKGSHRLRAGREHTRGRQRADPGERRG